jgi:anti-sigma28 factor (negative regulator of flagellin synthesis)
MNRNHFNKNPNQDDLFDVASQINAVKMLSDTSAELLMLDKLSESEYQDFMAKQIPEKKNKIESGWYQVSIESIFNINLNK